MYTRPKYLSVGVYFLVSSIIVAIFIMEEGNIGFLLSGFTSFWVMAGSFLLIIISVDEGDNWGQWSGSAMFIGSIYASVTSNDDIWFALAVIDALLIGYEMYKTGKEGERSLGDMVVIYLTTFSIGALSIIAGIS
jgi:hypothetical protein